MMFKFTTKIKILFLFAGILLILGIGCAIVILFIDGIFNLFITNELKLTPNSRLFEMWRSKDLPVYMSITLFEILNKFDVYKGAVPRFREVGPFVYKIYDECFNISFSSNQKMIMYDSKIKFTYDPNLSVDDPKKVRINVLNLVYTQLLSYAGVFKDVVNIATSYGHPFQAYLVHDYLWGYSEFYTRFSSHKPGLLVDLNNSVSHNTVLGTGVDNPANLGKVVLYRNNTQFSIWNNIYARMFNGSNGVYFGRNLEIGSITYAHAGFMCRSIPLKVIDSVTHPSIPAYKAYKMVTLITSEWDHNIYPPASIFKPHNEPEVPRGMVAMSPCIRQLTGHAIPIYISQPYFLGSPSTERNTFDGMRKPNKEKDSSYIVVEPVLGIPLKILQQVQMNIYLDELPDAFVNMRRPIYYPLGIFKILVEVDEETLKNMYYMIYVLKDQIKIGVAISSFILIMIATCLLVYIVLSEYKRSKTLISQ